MVGAPSLVRAGNGTTLLVFEPTWPREQTSYRLYDRDWQPLTPLLRVPASLQIQRGTTSGFIGKASLSRRNGSTAINAWILINRAGRVRALSPPPERAAQPRQGDLYLPGNAPSQFFAYRPEKDIVVRMQQPRWLGGGWYVDADANVNSMSNVDGLICALRSGPLSAGALRVSTDEGRSFSDIPVSAIIPSTSGPRLQACDATAQRIVVSTGGESPRELHTLDRTGNYLVSSRELGGQLDPYNWGMLPDGRLVTGTNRPGLMVATDSTNRLMDYRPGPVPVGWGGTIVGNEIVVVRRKELNVSTDAGLTWQNVDLKLP